MARGFSGESLKKVDEDLFKECGTLTELQKDVWPMRTIFTKQVNQFDELYKRKGIPCGMAESIFLVLKHLELATGMK